MLTPLSLESLLSDQLRASRSSRKRRPNERKCSRPKSLLDRAKRPTPNAPFDTMERRRPMSSSSTSLSHLKSHGQTVHNPQDGAGGHREKPNDQYMTLPG